MRNIAKNLYMALTMVCLAALVVFLIQLIIINSGTEPIEPDSVIARSSSVQDGEGEDEPENPFEDYTPPPPAPRPTPQGSRYEIQIDTDKILVIYAQDNLFNYVIDDFEWRFDYRGGGSAALEISFAYLSTGVAADTEMFLNRRIGENIAEYKGTQEIIDSQINSFSVGAQSGGVTFEAWLHRLPDSDLALAFLIFYEFNGQRDDLYTVLSSMSIEQGQVDQPPDDDLETPPADGGEPD